MTLNSESAIKNHIKSGKLSSLYLVYGDESYLSSHYANTLAASVTDTSGASFDYHIFDAETISFDALYEACETFPMMSSRVCVFIKDFPFQKTPSEELKQYTEYLKNLPETALVIFLITDTETEPSKNAKWKEIITFFNKEGVVFDISKRSEDSIAALLVRSAPKRNSSISAETAEYLISVTGSEMTNLLTEFDKICAYSRGKEITREMIDKIAVKSTEASVFDLASAINSRKNDLAMSILTTLIKNKVEPVIILGTLATQYTDAYRVKTGEKYGQPYSVFSKEFSGYKGKDYRLKYAKNSAKNLTLNQIKRIIEALSEADIKIKSFSVDNNIVLEELSARLLYITGDKNDKN